MNKKEKKKKMLKDIALMLSSLIYLLAGIGTLIFSGWLWCVFQITGLEKNIPLLAMPMIAGFTSLIVYFELLIE